MVKQADLESSSDERLFNVVHLGFAVAGSVTIKKNLESTVGSTAAVTVAKDDRMH